VIAAREAAETSAPAPQRLRRAIRLVGILCLVAALALGVYYGWLLWGTGIGTSHAQSRLRTQLSQEIAHPAPVPADPVGSGDGSAPPAQRIVVAPPKLGAPMAIIRIPRIHLDMVVVNGATTDTLKLGPGHYVGTAYPWEEHGAVAIAGHRTTYLHPFWSLDALRRGDLIRLATAHGTFDYRVTRSVTILPSEGWVLDQTRQPTLVLTTCSPRFSASHRLVVFADRES
jgi:sortase A